ncbi:MAG: MBL fold metallo-hydrolase [Ruminococcaceae bacterium]|jgi:metallo-beta-lactamase family protein|nr:MBL fold metallo-hydrolase [Oscillospiraceae bacterium]
MKLTFLGAAHEVTGSCTMIEAGSHYGLVDCGMEQGQDIYVNQDIPVDPSKLDFVLLTHAHIDHSGLLPLLYKRGFRGPIYATTATAHLCEIMLRDCAHIQESDAQWQTRKNKRAGNDPAEPLYDLQDAEGAISCLRPCDYREIYRIAENVEIRFVDVGHLLGSASIEVWLTENGQTRKVVFSGDIGNTNQPIIRDPSYVTEADYVITESTYGDREHDKGEKNSVRYLADCIQRVLDRGGNMVIPSFAVGRTQEILYFIRQIKLENMVTGHGDFPVYMDSPLANEATGIFLQCDRDNFDDEMRELLDRGVNPLVFPGLQIAVTSEESQAINFDTTPKVILSASGMCDAGRVRHHLKHNLWRKECMVLFVGYQAVGTTGRALFDGKKELKLFGEDISVKAEIAYLPGTSGHADKTGLLRWIEAFSPKPKMVFVNHGESDVADSYTKCLTEEHGFTASAPYSGAVYDLLLDRYEAFPDGVPVEKKNARQARNDTVFGALLDALDRLTAIVRSLKGIPNKDVARLTNQINSLADKWSRWKDK